MFIIFKHIMKNIFEKKFRTGILLLAIVLSTTVLFISLSVNDILYNTYSKMTQGTYGKANVLVTKAWDADSPFYAQTDLLLEAIVVDERLDMIQAMGTMQVNNEDQKVMFYGLDLETARQMDLVSPLNMEESNMKKGEALISAKTAEKYNLVLNDTLQVNVQNEPYTFIIGAIGESNGLLSAERDEIILITHAEEINHMYDTRQSVTSTLLKIPTSDMAQSIRLLEDANEAYTVEETGKAEMAMQDAARFQTTMLLAITIIVLISAYVISSLTKLIIYERMPVVGTFRSIGATKRTMNRILRIEFLLYGCIGAIIGLLLGMIALPYVADHFNEYKEFGIDTLVSFNGLYILIALVFGALFPLCISVFYISKGNKRQLKDIILDTSQVATHQSKLNLVIGLIMLVGSIILYFINSTDQLIIALLSVLFLFIAIVLLMPVLLNIISKGMAILFRHGLSGEAQLGIKNVANNRIASSNASMIVVVFLLLLMIGVTSSGLDRFIKEGFSRDFDILVAKPDLDFTTVTGMEDISGVSDVLYQYISAARLDDDGPAEVFHIYGVDDMKRFGEFFSGIDFGREVISDFNQMEDGIIIDSYQLKRYGLQIGDTISLQPLDKGSNSFEDKLIEFKIVGDVNLVTFSSNRDLAIIPQQYFDEYFKASFNQIALKVKEGEDASVVKEEIKQQYITQDIEILTIDELIGSQKQTIDTLLQGILIIILLGLVIGLLGITNNLLVSFMERKREFAVLYSVCMSKGQLVRIVVYEMLATFISVLIISWIAGIGMTVIWNRLLYAVGLKLAFSFNTPLFFILSGAVLLLLCIATLFIVRKLLKINVLSELRYA